MANDEKPLIESTRNGPFRVKNLKSMKNSKGEELNPPSIMMLCRCGGSKNKPYCDGTHMTNAFSDKKEPDRVKDRMDDYEGKDIIIHDNRGVCSHRGHCTGNAPKVFRRRVKPWIDPNAQDADKTVSVIEMCPSGALSYTKHGVLHKDRENEPAVVIAKDGPYDVLGRVKLEDPDGNKPESEEHYTLCRCGRSRNKPFCDGSHWHVKFRDPKN